MYYTGEELTLVRCQITSRITPPFSASWYLTYGC